MKTTFSNIYSGIRYGVNQAELREHPKLQKIWYKKAPLDACGYAAMTDCLSFYSSKDKELAKIVFMCDKITIDSTIELFADIYKKTASASIGIYTYQAYVKKFNRYLLVRGLRLSSTVFQEEGMLKHFFVKKNTLEAASKFIYHFLQKEQPIAFLNTSITGKKTAIGTNHWVTIVDIFKEHSRTYIRCISWGKIYTIALEEVWGHHDALTQIVLVAQEIKKINT